MLERLSESARPVKSLEDAARCARSAEFLQTVAELMEHALEGDRAPLSRCYVYDALENTLELQKISPVDSLAVRLGGPNNSVLLDAAHKNLLQLDFVSTHKLTGKKVYFTVYGHKAHFAASRSRSVINRTGGSKWCLIYSRKNNPSRALPSPR